MRWQGKVLDHLLRLRAYHKLTYEQIAERAGVSVAAVRKLFQRHGTVSPQKPRPPWAHAEIENAIDMEMDGLPVAEIAKATGRPVSGVQSKLRRMKWRA